MATQDHAFQFLVGQPVCAVTFIWDYYQLVIGTYIVSIYAHPVLLVDGDKWHKDKPGYADRLRDLIGKNVLQTQNDEDSLSLWTDDDVQITISFRSEDRVSKGPESLTVSDANGFTFLVEGDS